MKVIIKEEEIELKYSFRALMLFENIKGESFNPSTLTDILTFFYCIVIASKKDLNITFDDFMDWLDDNPYIVNDFSEWLSNISLVNEKLRSDNSKNGGNKKKSRK